MESCDAGMVLPGLRPHFGSLPVSQMRTIELEQYECCVPWVDIPSASLTIRAMDRAASCRSIIRRVFALLLSALFAIQASIGLFSQHQSS